MARTVGAVTLLLMVAACAPHVPAPDEPSRQALALGDEYLTRLFEYRPEWGTFLGWPATDPGAVSDPSPAAIARWHAFEDDILARARALELGRLDRTARLSRGILIEALEGSRAARACREELWDVSSIGGWQGQYPQLAYLQPVGTLELRAKAVARVRALATNVEAIRANLEEGLRIGYTASRDNVDRAIQEIGALLATPPAAWPLTSPAERDAAPGFREALAAAVAEAVQPAARQFHAYLVGTYRARARVVPGVLILPGGEVCYEGALRRATTLSISPRAIHEKGLAEVARIEVEMARIAERSFGTHDVGALLARVRTDAAYTFRSGDEILAVARGAVERARRAAPRWFGRVAQAPVEVRPFPAFMADSAPTDRYSPRFENGRLSGLFQTDTFKPTTRSRADVESIAFHEAVPGHHFQIALAAEGGASTPMARFTYLDGFNEGWALYAERLANEMGLYSSELDRLGQLANESLRAARLVVDPGMHALGWSRRQAIDYLLAHTALSPGAAASEIDRYAAWPGQATSYLLGALEIRRLRDEAQRMLGDRFDVRGFHDAVLGEGTVPLALLRENVARWREGMRRGPAAPVSPAASAR